MSDFEVPKNDLLTGNWSDVTCCDGSQLDRGSSATVDALQNIFDVVPCYPSPMTEYQTEIPAMQEYQTTTQMQTNSEDYQQPTFPRVIA